MKKKCEFNIEKVTINEVVRLLYKCKARPPGVDNLDAKFLSIAANLIAAPVCHIFYSCIEKGVCPQVWKIAKVIPIKILVAIIEIIILK